MLVGAASGALFHVCHEAHNLLSGYMCIFLESYCEPVRAPFIPRTRMGSFLFLFSFSTSLLGLKSFSHSAKLWKRSILTCGVRETTLPIRRGRSSRLKMTLAGISGQMKSFSPWLLSAFLSPRLSTPMSSVHSERPPKSRSMEGVTQISGPSRPGRRWG